MKTKQRQTDAMETRSKRYKKEKNRPASLPLAIKHKDYLTLLSKTKQANRRHKLVDAANKSEINAVTECIKNILNGNVPLGKSQLKQLRKYKTTLRSLANKCLATKEKKRVLKQRGGFIATLLPIALSALGSLFGGIFRK